MKKRIVVIAEYFPPRMGSDRRIFEFMKRLSKEYDVHFITLPPSYTLFIRKIDTWEKNEREVLYEGMCGHKLDLPKLILKLWPKSFLIAFAATEIYLCLQMLRKIAQLKPDMVIINDTSAYTGLLGFICSKIMNKKLLVDYNDLMGLYTFELVGKKVNRRLQAILRRILVLIEDTLVKHGWKVTAITVFIKDYAWTRNTRKDIIVIPNGVDTSLFDPAKVNGKEMKSRYSIRNGEKLCVYAGRIEEVAGAEIILETARLLKSEEKIRFMIVGEGDPEILSKFSECDNVILTGPVAKESIPEYLAAADIVFVPFPNTVASHGISPLKLFEALAMEKPVIASAIGGIKEIVGPDSNVILAEPDPECWASAVTKLVKKTKGKTKDKQLHREAICQKYGFDQLARVFGTIIESGLA